MPWKVEKDTNACPVDRPWAVKNSKTGAKRGCHASQASALKQQRLLYAKLNRGEIKMSELAFIVPVKQFADQTDDAKIKWIQAYPYDSWDHPIFGTTTITPEIAHKFVENFKNGVRGHEIATDYEHGLDGAKGNRASGWIRDMEARDDGLFFGVEFTETAKEEIRNGEWKYFSVEHYDDWEHPHTKETYEYVISGGGLTNKPWVKGMPAINFSEFYEEKGGTVPEGDEGTPKGESKEMEHSEPGTGTPPKPRTDDDGSDSKDIKTGSRRDTPPAGEDSEASVELDKQLREALGLPEDADIIKAVTEMKEEVEPLREAAKAHSEKKAFAEAYPDEFGRLQRLEEKNRKTEAKAFAEDYERFAKTDGDQTVRLPRGFSQKIIDKLESIALKSFSERLSVADLGEVLDMIADDGIVEFSEKGSSRSRDSFTPQSENPRKAFAELVAKLQEDDKLSYGDAVTEAAKRDPELFAAYHVARPVE